jgi:hypothetical protein
MKMKDEGAAVLPHRLSGLDRGDVLASAQEK